MTPRLKLRFRRVGLETDGFAQLGYRLRQFPQTMQSLAEVGVEVGMVGVEAGGLAQLGDGFLRLPLGDEGEAEIAVGAGMIGPETDGFAQLGDCLGQLPLAPKRRLRGWSGRRESWA